MVPKVHSIRNIRYAIFACIFCWAMLALPAQVIAAQLNDIRYGPHKDKDRIVFDFSGPVTISLKMETGSREMVLELGDVALSEKISSIQKLGPVEAVKLTNRASSQKALTFYLAHNSHVVQAFWLPGSTANETRYVVDLALKGQKPAQNARDIMALVNEISDTVAAPTNEPVTPPAMVKPIPNSAVVVAGVPVPLKKPALRTTNLVATNTGWKPLIIIDPGHGGKDPGAKAGNAGYEKTIVLSLAKELATALEATGRYRTKLTRDDDRFIKLRDRVNFAREHKGDLFISIHADSINDRHVTGASVYTLSDKASDAQTARLAARENKADLIAGVDLSHEDKEVASILLDLVTRDTTNQSKFFANLLVSNFKSNDIKTLKTAHRHAGFAVLKAPDIPAVLVESGFVSNPKEVEKLKDPSYRRQMARAITSGVDSYFMRLAALRTQ